MKIPSTVCVNGVVYRVAVRPRKAFAPEDDLDGICCQEQSLIVLAKELGPTQRVAAYVHELAHAAMHESGAGVVMEDFTKKADRLEELLISTFVPVFYVALGEK